MDYSHVAFANTINEVYETEDNEDFDSLRRKATSTDSQSKLIDINSLKNQNLEVSREIVLTLKAYLDEAERDLFAHKWDKVLVYLSTVSDQENAFVDLIDNLYPSNDPVESAAKSCMHFEAKSLFLSLDNLRKACQEHQIETSEKYYAKLLLSYDRFLKAGDLYPTYDPIPSTEIFFKDTPSTTLRFDETSGIKKLDNVILKIGPDMGKTGRVIYIDDRAAVVKLDKDGKDYQEVKWIPLDMLAKTTI
jgi:hypothetical protein